MNREPLAPNLMQPIPRHGDQNAFLINWSGGLQSAEINNDQWKIYPIQYSNKPHISGFYTKASMFAFMRDRGAKFIAYQQIIFNKGSFNSHWAPFIPNQSNFSESPADRWGNVASNLTRARSRPMIEALDHAEKAQIDEILDAHSEPERLARSIALSLRCLDTSVSDIAAFYNEELTNLLASGSLNGHGHSNMRDQGLFSLIHAFFLHIGSVRDYLGAFLALQLGMDHQKTDSMARLIDALREPHTNQSPILQLLANKGYIIPKPAPSTKWELAGGLAEVTDLRNEFTHRRTYGQTRAERMGHLRPLDGSVGLYRYFRPISWTRPGEDVFDVIIGHYEMINELFFTAAELSGHDMSILQINDRDVISSDTPSDE